MNQVAENFNFRKKHARRVRRDVQLRNGTIVQLSVSQLTFLEAYRKTGVINRASKMTGFNRQTHAHWRREDEAYRMLFDEITEDLADDLEFAARKRAIKGVRQVKFTKSGDPLRDPRKHDPETGQVKEEFKDDPWYYEDSFSDRLLEMLLKAKRPDEFKDRQSIEHSGPGGQPMEMEIAARQIAIANPDLADQMCLALERVIEHERIESNRSEPGELAGSDGNAAGVCVDGEQGPVQAGESSIAHESPAGGPGGWSNQEIDDLLSPPARQEPAVQQKLSGLVLENLPDPPGHAGEL